ncbi:hypothetical protein ACIQZI_13190 [Peribacillus sp. NPDC096379]|uniref:hypothetical protein n=1 Tax=Peribacillus sp. NPDC096379 TaxID=3364393 RepID=UPI0038262553
MLRLKTQWKISIETKLGAYCWKGETESTCVDIAGLVELLENVKPIHIQPGVEVTFEIDYEPKPKEVNVSNGDAFYALVLEVR